MTRLRSSPARRARLLAAAALVAASCRGPSAPSGVDGTFAPAAGPPTYHVLEGYDPRWRAQVEDGVELARAFWGSFGPVHVWVAGVEGEAFDPVAAAAFVDDYCRWRADSARRAPAELRERATERFLDVVARGDAEAYLSWHDDTTPPSAELVFLNVHRWYFEHDPIPDPVLRGVHEYTHVFQKAFGPTPTWIMEGGAVFAEAWVPWTAGRCARARVAARLQHSLAPAQRATAAGLSIADMEDIDAAAPEVRRYYRELAYDAGAWATVWLVHRSASRSVADLRDVFFPSVDRLGWEAALCRHARVAGMEAFYAGFAAFLAGPDEVRQAALRGLRP